jgi:demethylmenaquinone methyltransferase/2-methoxy-6-polyprenyl-1,4-benzoquinol methylase
MSLPPLLGESAFWARPEDRQRAVNALFDRGAAHYDRVCNVMSFGSGQRYRRRALIQAGVRPGHRVLDVGTGTGLLAREIAHAVESSGRVVGVDPSRAMMAAGRSHLALPLVQGLGESLPVRSGMFDFVTMGYALRHVPDLETAFSEYQRVLKPGGYVLLLEITRPASPLGAAAVRWYFGGVVPMLARLTTGSADAARLMEFYSETIDHCVAPDVVLDTLAQAGFEAVRRDVEAGIFSAYTGRRAK